MGRNTIKQQYAGFTLIEVILVILIVGIILSMAGLSINRGGAEKLLAEDVRHIAAKWNLLAEESIITGQHHAIRLHQQGIDYWIYKESGWVKIGDNLTYKSHSWKEVYRLQIKIDGEPIQLPPADVLEPIPQLYLFSSGEQTPFVLKISLDKDKVDQAPTAWLLKGAVSGKISLRKVDN
ncbi:MAG: prepilin-type N-terminal cleavage/methylation domain-containing protein [Candidatus Marinimicrobia bacterium]|nr:prepilin-type N-terminal cleavage/methylation domain-containing protein [Candidatus Neomarinimicrobiota bacterium]